MLRFSWLAGGWWLERAWVAVLAIWWMKPAYDRVVLHVLSRHRRWHDRLLFAGIGLGVLLSLLPLLVLGTSHEPARRLALGLLERDVFALVPFAWGARAAVHGARGELGPFDDPRTWKPYEASEASLWRRQFDDDQAARLLASAIRLEPFVIRHRDAPSAPAGNG